MTPFSPMFVALLVMPLLAAAALVSAVVLSSRAGREDRAVMQRIRTKRLGE